MIRLAVKIYDAFRLGYDVSAAVGPGLHRKSLLKFVAQTPPVAPTARGVGERALYEASLADIVLAFNSFLSFSFCRKTATREKASKRNWEISL